MNYGEIKNVDIANGLGNRVSLFVSGCTHRCKGCFNPDTWNFDFGKPFTEEVEQHILNLLDKPYIQGLTILGGEPMEPSNQKVLVEFIKRFKDKFDSSKDLWIYSGYTFEELTNQVENRCYVESITDDILEMTDVLVDGKFVLELKDISLKFRGSSNQRVIDVKKSLENKQVAPFEFK